MASRDINQCTPTLREYWPRLQEWYSVSNPDKELFLTATHRTPKEQKSIYDRNKPGAVLTRCDGYKILSPHNYTPSKAFDVAIRDRATGRVIWEDSYYICLGESIKACGFEGRIRWGGWWSSFKDFPHFEEI